MSTLILDDDFRPGLRAKRSGSPYHRSSFYTHKRSAPRFAGVENSFYRINPHSVTAWYQEVDFEMSTLPDVGISGEPAQFIVDECDRSISISETNFGVKQNRAPWATASICAILCILPWVMLLGQASITYTISIMSVSLFVFVSILLSSRMNIH